MYGLLFYSFSYGTMSFYVHNLSDKYAFIFALKELSRCRSRCMIGCDRSATWKSFST